MDPSGKWRIDDFSENKTNYVTNLKLSANITMVSKNGTGEHKHRLIDFRLTNLTFSNRLAIMNGTASLVTSGNEQPGLPAFNDECSNNYENRKFTYYKYLY